MAKGRFISKSLAADRKIKSLSSDTSRLGFVCLITQADCEGRTTGEPRLLLGNLFPWREDLTAQSIETFILEWIEAGFVVWYQAPEGDRYLQLRHFFKHQHGLRKEREPKSEIPAPEDCLILGGTLPEPIRQSAGKFQAEVKEEVESEDESEDESEVNAQAEARGLPAALNPPDDDDDDDPTEKPPDCLRLFTENISGLLPCSKPSCSRPFPGKAKQAWRRPSAGP